MKFPNHIVLDVSNNTKSENFYKQYWAGRYALLLKNNIKVTNSFSFQKFFTSKNVHNLKFTKFHTFFSYKLTHTTHIKKLKTVRKNKIFNKIKIWLTVNNNINVKSLKFWTLFDINFLRKEKIYTKLKYSRTPQYDIVSGGVAAIFSGFLGFLICEKFGFELLDSGDFYFLFMYVVFLSFSGRLLIKIINLNNKFWNFLSIKWFFNFYKILFHLIASVLPKRDN